MCCVLVPSRAKMLKENEEENVKLPVLLRRLPLGFWVLLFQLCLLLHKCETIFSPSGNPSVCMRCLGINIIICNSIWLWIHTHTHSSGSNSSTLSLILFIYFYSRKTADIALRCITSREEEERSFWGASFRPPSYKSLSSAPIESSRNKETGRPRPYICWTRSQVFQTGANPWVSLFFSSLFLLIFRRKKKNVLPLSRG